MQMDNWCLRRIVNIHWSEFVTRGNSYVFSDTLLKKKKYVYSLDTRTVSQITALEQSTIIIK